MLCQNDGDPLLFTSISPAGHLSPLLCCGCHCPVLDLNAALLSHSIPSMLLLLLYQFRCIVCKMCSAGFVPFQTICCWAFLNSVQGHGREHSPVSSVLGGHRFLCPRWTQTRTQSHCASGIVKPVAQVQMLDATIRLLLILLLVVASGQWAHSPVGPRILPKIPTCILCNEHWRAFKGYFLCTFSSNLNSEKYSFGFWRLVGVSRALV